MIITVEGHRFGANWLRSVSLNRAVKESADKPREVVETAWNIANGKHTESEEKPKAKTTRKK